MMARLLRVYARVLVEGEEHLVKSNNAVRVVALDGYNDWQLTSGDRVEDLRRQAYVAAR
jgi:hypothetical protein